MVKPIPSITEPCGCKMYEQEDRAWTEYCADHQPDPKIGMTGPQIFHLLQLKYAMQLEMKGFKHSQGSVYALLKRRYGLKGNKQKVYDQFVAKFKLDNKEK